VWNKANSPLKVASTLKLFNKEEEKEEKRYKCAQVVTGLLGLMRLLG
jgi:hypothetical protein